jgi:hypothetical protein
MNVLEENLIGILFWNNSVNLHANFFLCLKCMIQIYTILEDSAFIDSKDHCANMLDLLNYPATALFCSCLKIKTKVHWLPASDCNMHINILWKREAAYRKELMVISLQLITNWKTHEQCILKILYILLSFILWIIPMKEKFEDYKWVIKSCKLKKDIIQWPKEWTQTNDPWTLPKTLDGLRWSGRVSCSCSTCSTHHVTFDEINMTTTRHFECVKINL